MVSTGYNLIANPSIDSKHEDEGNTGNTVAQVVGISPLKDESGYPVVLASQGYFVLNVFWRLVKMEFSFDGALCSTYFHSCIFHLANFVWVTKIEYHCLGFRLQKCNWVDTGQ